MTKQDKINRARERMSAQRKWVEEHGGDIAGYVARYGSSDAPVNERYGDGGERIYAADKAELDKLEAEFRALTTARQF